MFRHARGDYAATFWVTAAAGAAILLACTSSCRRAVAAPGDPWGGYATIWYPPVVYYAPPVYPAYGYGRGCGGFYGGYGYRDDLARDLLLDDIDWQLEELNRHARRW